MIRVRFAPSPTGFVHVGNARTALFNFLHAQRKEGKMILRIEDTDVERSRKEYEDNLVRDMKWLGIEWDEGPGKGGEFGPYRQSERTELYLEYAKRLIDNGHAYYCFCSSEDLQKEKESGEGKDGTSGYSGKCRHLDIDESKEKVASGTPAAIRLKIPPNQSLEFYDLVREKVAFDSNLLSDPIILRSTGMPAYNFSVVIDDHLMGVNLVVRGEDHISNTARQLVLYDAFGFERPQFAHLSMVMGEDNTKLSKRHGSTSILQFREEGYLPQALFNYLALLGWSPGGKTEILTPDQLKQNFNLKKVSKAAAIFDYQKLKWMNREHLRMLPDSQLVEFLLPFLHQAGFTIASTPEANRWIARAARTLGNYNYLMTEIARDFHQFCQADITDDLIQNLRNSENDLKVISFFYNEIRSMTSPIEFSTVSEITKKIQDNFGIKGRELYHPLRLALTGKESGIELKDFIPLIEIGSALNLNPPVLNMAARLKTIAS